MPIRKKNYKKRHSLRENCAIFGVTCDDIGFSVSKLLNQGLIALQHRGQESTGISVLKTGGNIHTYKKNSNRY